MTGKNFYKWLRIDLGSGSILDRGLVIKLSLCRTTKESLALLFSDERLINDIHNLIKDNFTICNVLLALFECCSIQNYSYNPTKYIGDEFVGLLYNRGDLASLLKCPQKKLRKDMNLWMKYIKGVQLSKADEVAEYCMHRFVMTQIALFSKRIIREHKLTVPICLDMLSDVDFAQLYNDINAAVFVATGNFNCFDVADILSAVGG